jgi:pimeloyl-ACP methyl ester carboxylesterase
VVSVPVQVLLGERSALHNSPEVAARLAEAVPAWRAEIVPGTGHALPLEAPELVINRILRLTSPGQSTATEPPAASQP